MSRSIISQDASYRRGLLLGLTMAEIVILIIFCLLLLLSSILIAKQRKVEELSGSLERKTKENARLEEKVKYLYAGISNQSQFDNLFHELELARERGDEANSLRKQIAELKEREKFLDDKVKLLAKNLPDREKFAVLNQELDLARKKATEAESLSRQVEDLRERTRILDDIGGAIPMTISDKDNPAEKVQDLLKRVDRAEDLFQALEEHGFPTDDPTALRENLGKSASEFKMAAKNQELKRNVDTLKGQLKNMIQKFEGLGKGTEMPACWADPDTGKPEYIFNVALTTSGLIVRDSKVPHRAKEQAELHTDTISFDKEVSPARFLEEALRIYEWSVKHDCRFFVRAFDLTKDHEKRVYKRHLRILEMRFYKYEPLDFSFDQASFGN